MLGILFDILPKLGLLIIIFGTIAALLAGMLLIMAGQWALGVVLLVAAAGGGFLVFKLWQSLQPAD